MMTAEYARELSKMNDDSELNEILENIKIEAMKGNRKLSMYKCFSKFTHRLIELGFTVDDNVPSISIQKEGYYGSISW